MYSSVQKLQVITGVDHREKETSCAGKWYNKQPAGVIKHTLLHIFDLVSVGAGRNKEIGQFYGILIMTSRFSDANKSLMLIKSGDRSMISLLYHKNCIPMIFGRVPYLVMSSECYSPSPPPQKKK